MPLFPHLQCSLITIPLRWHVPHVHIIWPYYPIPVVVFKHRSLLKRPLILFPCQTPTVWRLITRSVTQLLAHEQLWWFPTDVWWLQTLITLLYTGNECGSDDPASRLLSEKCRSHNKKVVVLYHLECCFLYATMTLNRIINLMGNRCAKLFIKMFSFSC